MWGSGRSRRWILILASEDFRSWLMVRKKLLGNCVNADPPADEVTYVLVEVTGRHVSGVFLAPGSSYKSRASVCLTNEILSWSFAEGSTDPKKWGDVFAIARDGSI